MDRNYSSSTGADGVGKWEGGWDGEMPSVYNVPLGGTTHNGLISATSITNQENISTDKSDEGSFFTEVLSSQVTLACVKSTKTNHHRT